MSSLLRSVLILVATLFVAGCAKKADPVEVSREFFRLMAEGKTEEAYRMGAFSFQAQLSYKSFSQAVEEMGFAKLGEPKLGETEAEGKKARVPVEFKPDSENPVKLVVSLNKENGAWKVYSVRTPKDVRTGLSRDVFGSIGRRMGFREEIDKPMPDAATQKQMVLETLMQFNEAVQKKDFGDFYENCSRAWKAQLTKGQLERAFQDFMDKNVNIEGIAKYEPVFSTQPEITTAGLLVMNGYYPTQPFRVSFSLRFVHEATAWRLYGLDVSLSRPDAPKEDEAQPAEAK